MLLPGRDQAQQSKGLGRPVNGLFRQFHRFRAPEQPIHADVKLVSDLGQTVNVERPYPREMEIDRVGAEQVMIRFAQAACFIKVLM